MINMYIEIVKHDSFEKDYTLISFYYFFFL